ncbi:MAG TPA: 50S ribosomal protein L25/general stress protein Ctc [Alphaproteobacteria bacterium]|nr:50S ribosomal protein L25/general stress protein Ctc [Alphaproteobacteria bacterium]
MVDATKIAAQPRERAGKGASRAVRRAGRVPGVIYGEKAPPTLIDLDPKAVQAEIDKPGFFTRVFDVEIGGKVQRALARDIQLHPVTDRPEHVDFMRVGATTRIRVGIPVKFINQDKSPGLKRGGVLNVVRHTIEVYCRVDNIPQSFSIDLDGLDIGDSIHISKVKLPEGVKPTITTRDFTIAAVAAPSVLKTAEEEAAEAAAAAAAATPAEGAAAAPGAAPAAGAAPGAPGAAAPAAGAAGAKGAAPAAAAGAKPGAAPAAGAKAPAPKK